MSLFVWIILGLIVGFLASKIFNRAGGGQLLDYGLGIAGAVIGGWLLGGLGTAEVSGLNLYSFLVAVVGAALLLAVYHMVYPATR